MTAALPNNVIALPLNKAKINLTDLPMNKELDQAALKNLVGGHGAGGSTRTTYYDTKQTQRYGFLKRHRKVRHYTRRTVQKWHAAGRWGRWHIHF